MIILASEASLGEGILLDTHTIVWWLLDAPQLSRKACALIQDNEIPVFFSPVSTMEVTTKVRIGKFEIARPFATNFESYMLAEGFEQLVLTSVQAELAGTFVSKNNDPWDRLLAAQAKLAKLTLISNDSKMADFGISQFW